MKNGWITDKNGDRKHYLNDRLHNDDGPAIEFANGNKSYYKKGKLHREDGPACVIAGGTSSYYLNGNFLYQYEFENRIEKRKHLQEKEESSKKTPLTNPFITTYAKFWYNEQHKLHREDGPAVEWNTGGKEWLQNGVYHRLDGPAIECAYNISYYINGIYQNKKAFEDRVLELNARTHEACPSPSYSDDHSDTENSMMTKPSTNSGAESIVGDPVTFLTKLQQNAKAAGPRILCKTISKGARAALIHLMKSKKMKKSWIRTVSEMMKTEYGLAFVSFGLSLLFKYVPALKDDLRAQYVADEFQIQSVEMIGNELVDEIMSFLLPAIMEFQEVRIEKPSTARIENSPEEEEEDNNSIDDLQIRAVA